MAPKTVTWEADPHTLAKHAILRKYLGGWYPKMTLGAYGKKRIGFIDGFCGPGEYRGGAEGSPIIALRTLLEHQARDEMLKAAEFKFLFIDSDPRRLAHLQETAVPRLDLPPQVEVLYAKDEFDRNVRTLLDDIESRGSQLAPVFAFIDPFGYSDIPMTTVERIARNGNSEVFVTFMTEFVNRFLEHPSTEHERRLDELFGTTTWRALANEAERAEALSDFYLERLGERAAYTWSFRMFGERNRALYDLMFSTNHLAGLKQMKSAMWKVDPVSGARFSDTAHAPGQQGFFDDEKNTDALRAALLREYKGRDPVEYSSLELFVLTRTQFHDGQIKKATLEPMEREGLIAWEQFPNGPARKSRALTYRRPV